MLNYIEFISFEILYTSLYIVILYFLSSLLKSKYDDSTQYFILHFIHNMIITSIVAPYCLTMLSDPVGTKKDYLLYKNNYEFLFPMISGLHTFHLICMVLYATNIYYINNILIYLNINLNKSKRKVI